MHGQTHQRYYLGLPNLETSLDPAASPASGQSDRTGCANHGVRCEHN